MIYINMKKGMIWMKYVIIGGDAAGMSAAMQLLKHDKTAEITILESGAVYSYAQCGMPYAISGVIADVDDLVIRDVDTYRKKYGMDARVYHRVDQVNPDEKLVSGHNLATGENFQMAYDRLLLASGASPFMPKWAGDELNGVHVVKSLADTEAIIAQMETDVADVMIVGGGYIGLEMAESFRMLGKRVSILIRSKQIAKMFDDDMAQLIEEEAARHEIAILYEEEVVELMGADRLTSIRTNKQTYETDLLLVATGVRPNTGFLADTGVALAKNGAVVVNEYLETNVENIYAAGDCATQYHRLKQTDDYVPLGTNANKQGRLAGLNMAGKRRAFQGITGTSILKFMDITLGKTGLSDREAANVNLADTLGGMKGKNQIRNSPDAKPLGLQLPYQSVTIKASSHAGYYPNAKSLQIKLTFHSESGLLLGGQVIGEAGVDKRVDVLATALFNEMTVEALEDLDLSYAPPYNSTWDPVQRAARKAVGKLEG